MFKKFRDLPGRPVVKTLPLNAGEMGLIPGWGAEIPRALWPKKKKQTKTNRRNIVASSAET